MELKDQLKIDIREYPTGAGVYIMKDTSGDVIYVGKAKNMRARLRSYFAEDLPVKTRVLMSRVVTIDYVLTANEYEALLLENNLIKNHRP
ncbi:MAG: GIY-YIG nuclease family protein, partial [Alkalispirochaeta sp.]